MLNIKKYNLPYSKEDIEYVQKHIELVLKNGYLTDGGEYVKNFESTWSDIINVKNSIAVNSCTTALEIILKAIDVRHHCQCTMLVQKLYTLIYPKKHFL